MSTIKYIITNGTPPFDVSITPEVVLPNYHIEIGNFEFNSIPDGNYIITVTDNNSCQDFIEVNVNCNITTTTSTLSPTTTSTTTINETICGYGLLYNWYVITDVRNISNVDWKVPTSNDYTTLSTYLGGNLIAGGKLKEIGYDYWLLPNTNATNESGFNGRGSGYLSGGMFDLLNEQSMLWTSTNYSTDYAYQSRLTYDSDYFYTSNVNDKKNGQSIRLIKENTTLSNGQKGNYIGNDGTVYQTICIGTQEWISENLRETKYRNGDYIPNIPNILEWEFLTIGALCAYDNDWYNACMTIPDYPITTTTTTLEQTTTTTTLPPTTTTTTTEEKLLMYSFDVDTQNAVDFPWFEMDFNVLTGNIEIDFGDGYTIIDRSVDTFSNSWVGYEYVNTITDWYQILYPDPAGVFNVKIYFKKAFPYQTLQTALDETWLIYLYDLEVTNTLDISMFPNISNFDMQHASVSSIILPQTFSTSDGLDAFMLHTVSNLLELDMSNSLLPTSTISQNRGGTNNITIGYCNDLQTIYFPKGDDYMHYVDIYNCSSLQTINIDKNLDVNFEFVINDCDNLVNVNVTNGNSNSKPKSFGIYNCPSLSYFDVTKWSNLTNISGTTTSNVSYYFYNNNWTADIVNRVLIDFDSISVSGYANRRILIGGTNASPDSSSGGYDGLAAKLSLESKGFTVLIS